MAEACVCSSASRKPSLCVDSDVFDSGCLVAITTGEAMGLVNGLNAISSQAWAVVLILLGIATLVWLVCATQPTFELP
jgi:hypothetical protein